jgi:hypothetical protein
MVPDPVPPEPADELEPLDALAHAWRTLRADPVPVAGAGLGVAVLGVLGVALGQVSAGTSVVAWLCWSVVLLALGHVLWAVLVRASLDVLDGGRFDAVDAARRLPLPPLVTTGLVVGALVTTGTVLCVVPGVVLAVLTCFTTVVVVDEGVGPVEAVRRSASLVVAHAGDVLAMVLVVLGVLLAGLLLCVGTVVALPLASLAWTYAYRWLTDEDRVPPVELH